MKRMKVVLKSFGVLCLSFVIAWSLVVGGTWSVSEASGGSTYYVDAINGDDANNGLSTSAAFKSLDKLNAMVFQPGDRILFKAGCTWNGYFAPKGSGAENQPIIVNAYDESGNEVQGALPLESKPYIKNNGADQTGDSRIQYQHAYAIHLKNVEYWEINNMQCSVDNDDVWQGTFGNAHHYGDKWTSYANKGRDWVGIMVEARDYDNNGDQTIDHIYLRNNYVHDVDGNFGWWQKDGFSGGITYLVWTDAMDDGQVTPQEESTMPINTFNDVLIENCYVKNSSRAGITVGTSIWYPKFDGYNGIYPDSVMNTYASKNIIIRNNVMEMTTGDGIEVLYAVAPLVEYNLAIKPGQDTLNNNSREFTSAGIWCWRSPNALFQYNEVYGCNNMGDGQAWDVDWTYEVIYQYNYSHDNRGGALLMCLGESRNSTFRYNISQNDRYFVDDLNSGPDNHLYNNTFIAGPYTEAVFKRKGGAQKVENNIFYVPNGQSVNANWDDADTYDNNCYYGLTPPASDSNKITSDPKFVSNVPIMDTVLTGKALSGTYDQGTHNNSTFLQDQLVGLKLQETSPCINAGKTIANPGTKDFWGNALFTGQPDIGAYEHPVLVNPNPGNDVNYALNKPTVASMQHNSGIFNAENATDGDHGTRWATTNVTSCWLEVDLGQSRSFNKAVIREFAQRVLSYQIEYWEDNSWKVAYTGTTIGTEVTCEFPAVTSNKVRLNILNATKEPTIYELEIY